MKFQKSHCTNTHQLGQIEYTSLNRQRLNNHSGQILLYGSCVKGVVLEHLQKPEHSTQVKSRS